MSVRVRGAVGGSRALSHTGWALLLVVFIGGIVGLAFVSAPQDELGPVSPDAEWEWDESAETISLSHEGGDAIERETLSIRYGDDLEETISDLGAEDDERLIQPFEDPTVAEGHMLEVDRELAENGTLVLLWEDADSSQSATLAQYDDTDNST